MADKTKDHIKDICLNLIRTTFDKLESLLRFSPRISKSDYLYRNTENWSLNAR